MFDRIVQTGNFNEEIGRKVFRDLASGLDYLHGRGIAHKRFEAGKRFATIK